jgi:hypothetical protein
MACSSLHGLPGSLLPLGIYQRSFFSIPYMFSSCLSQSCLYSLILAFIENNPYSFLKPSFLILSSLANFFTECWFWYIF